MKIFVVKRGLAILVIILLLLGGIYAFRTSNLFAQNTGYGIIDRVLSMIRGPPSCTAGYKCYSATVLGYQNRKCKWSNLRACTNGCLNNACVSGANCQDIFSCSGNILVHQLTNCTNVSQNCPFGCANNACKSDPCTGVSCPNVCTDANNLNTSGNCFAGSCQYTTIPCTYGCANGACKSNPCAGISCPNICQDTTTLKINGQCVSGACQYFSQTCQYGCANDTCNNPPSNQTISSDRVQIFYYPWYGNVATDGRYIHWGQNGRTPPDDIGSNFYPQLGPYSSADRATVAQHMAWIHQAGIGVIVYSWWGQSSRENQLASLVLQEADKQDVKVAWHMEPYTGRNAASVVADIKYIYDTYGSSPAFFKVSRATKYGNTNNPRGVFYVFESSGGNGAIPAVDWRTALDSLHSDATYNAIVIGQGSNACLIDGCDTTTESHFDGLYTYDGLQVDGSGFANSNTQIKSRNSIFTPSVAPGYVASRATTDTRVKARYDSMRAIPYTYDSMWDYAIKANTEWVSITSFNEWHEGSQIEPAVPKTISTYTYQDYNDFDANAGSDLYLIKTLQNVNKYLGINTSTQCTLDSQCGSVTCKASSLITPKCSPSGVCTNQTITCAYGCTNNACNAAPSGDPILVGAGDIGSISGNGDEDVAKVLDSIFANNPYGLIFTAGDNMNEAYAPLEYYLNYFDPTWGRHKSLIRPATGNHDYAPALDGTTLYGAGYFDYFNGVGVQTGPAGNRSAGYYSYNLGSWHIIVLNSNCNRGDACGSGDKWGNELAWLNNDLDANTQNCIAAYWHHPLFSSGQWGNQVYMKPFWDALYAHHADIVMNGHSHDYERFALQNPSGAADANGIREFVVGTGGRLDTQTWNITNSNSQVRADNVNGANGVLKFTLHSNSYDWQFVPVAGKTFTDTGSQACHPKGDPCAGISCPNVCQDISTLKTNGQCVSGVCQYSNQPCAYGCANNACNSPPSSSFRFVAWGDTKSGGLTGLATLSNQAILLNPAFTIFSGDLEEAGFTQVGMDAWKAAVNGNVNNGMFDKTIPARGNHDSANIAGWQAYYNVAATVASVGGSNYNYLVDDITYSFDYGNSHFVALDVLGDVNTMTTAQITWLDSDLAAAESRGLVHAFLYWHGPIYPGAEHCCAVPPSSLVTVLNKHPIVSATFHGHEHSLFYEHIDGTRITGVTHPFEEFVTANAGVDHTYPMSRPVDWSMTLNCPVSGGYCSPPIHGFATIDVSGTSFTVSAYKKGITTPQNTWTFNKGSSQCTIDAQCGSVTCSGSTLTTPICSGGSCTTQTSACTYGCNTTTNNNCNLPPRAGSVLTFTPTDDATIKLNYSGTNFGSDTEIHVDNSPVENFLFKFSLSGISGKQVTSVKLRLYDINPSANGGSFYTTASNSWTEGSITWNNAPAIGTLLASTGSVAQNTWVEVNLPTSIISDGVLSMRVTTTSSDAAFYSSKEGANPPQLVIMTS